MISLRQGEQRWTHTSLPGAVCLEVQGEAMDHFRAVMMSKCMAGLVCVCERGRVVHVLVERVRVLTVIIINIFFVRITHCWENHPIYQYINIAQQTVNTL